jgi:hypothetical protein
MWDKYKVIFLISIFLLENNFIKHNKKIFRYTKYEIDFQIKESIKI